MTMRPDLTSPEPRCTGPARLTTSVLDRVGAAVLLLLTAPLLLGVALVVRRDGGPALHLQERVGNDGRAFRLARFRSTSVDTADPRLTPVGALLRRYSLDELPQLFNVLSGSLSFVGTRPRWPGEATHHDARRPLVRAGLIEPWVIGSVLRGRDAC